MNTPALSGVAKLAAAFVVGWLYLHGYGQGPTGILTQAKASLSNAPAFAPLALGTHVAPVAGLPIPTAGSRGVQ